MPLSPLSYNIFLLLLCLFFTFNSLNYIILKVNLKLKHETLDLVNLCCTVLFNPHFLHLLLAHSSSHPSSHPHVFSSKSTHPPLFLLPQPLYYPSPHLFLLHHQPPPSLPDRLCRLHQRRHQQIRDRSRHWRAPYGITIKASTLPLWNWKSPQRPHGCEFCKLGGSILWRCVILLFLSSKSLLFFPIFFSKLGGSIVDAFFFFLNVI